MLGTVGTIGTDARCVARTNEADDRSAKKQDEADVRFIIIHTKGEKEREREREIERERDLCIIIYTEMRERPRTKLIHTMSSVFPKPDRASVVRQP